MNVTAAAQGDALFETREQTLGNQRMMNAAAVVDGSTKRVQRPAAGV